MSTDYYKKESWIDSTFSKRGKFVLISLLSVMAAGIVVCGCGAIHNISGANKQETPQAEQTQVSEPVSAEEKQAVKVPEEDNKVDLNVDENQASAMVSYDVTSIGRSDPFMPSSEILAYEDARNAAISEANLHNSQIAEIKRLKNLVIREPDDISPYSFNLPVPPTSLASADTAAAKIMRTKVVGIMYNQTSPSAIISLDDKDYLVRAGDKIIGQEYKVVQINPNWITVGLGSNIYSAGIGELFSKDEFDKSQNDLYNLKDRFGGRKG